MKISIITPSFNQGQFIEQTIRSVMKQNHNDVEHIIIDGGSTDDTVSILKKYPRLHWISEKDSGQSNAINKGFQRATGDIIAWLNSDDFYEENVLSEVASYFKMHPNCMVLYGDITYVDKEGKTLFMLSGDNINYESLIRCPDYVRQPSTFWRRDVINEVGNLDGNLRLVMDFDFFLRIARRYTFHYVNRNLSYFRMYEENKTSSFPRRQIIEIYGVFKKQQVPLDKFHLKYFARKLAESFAAGRTLLLILRLMKKRKTYGE